MSSPAAGASAASVAAAAAAAAAGSSAGASEIVSSFGHLDIVSPGGPPAWIPSSRDGGSSSGGSGDNNAASPNVALAPDVAAAVAAAEEAAAAAERLVPTSDRAQVSISGGSECGRGHAWLRQTGDASRAVSRPIQT
jgi:hypothetical protein